VKNILVTGGAGYVGSHTCKLLAVAGYEPITFDNLSTGFKSSVKWGPLIVGELSQTELLVKSFEKYEVVAVIHFAASSYVGESVANPFKYYLNNVGGTISLLDAMTTVGLKDIVFSSTCATYGTPEVKLISESCSQLPINPYGQSKLMIEKILDDMSRKNEISHICLRYFNAAGADKDCEIGERHDPETHLIPLAIRSALGGPILKVFGTDFLTPDGTAVRDYVHVEDLGNAHILAVEKLLAGGLSDFYNLGTGTGTSVLQIIDSLKRLGLPVKHVDARRREGDPAYLVANANKANSDLNWQPIYNKIDDLLTTAIRWHFRDA
jgi:UDP-glucose-4-epimerase GalE